MSDTNAIAVFMTAANGEEAARLAEILVLSRLAACVQIMPKIESVYRWKGNVERQSEVLLIAKTLRSRFEEFERAVRALHSYETPEIIALPITTGSAPYLKWLAENVESEHRAEPTRTKSLIAQSMVEGAIKNR
jgi:periplasmic divalent cation tolerance protein